MVELKPRYSHFKIKIPAKINMWLQVVRKRQDGYHDLWSLMVPVSVLDEMEVKLLPSTDGIKIECNNSEVPDGKSNIIWQAIKAYEDKTGKTLPGIYINLKKNIPIGAGLGGGSANAGAILKGLNQCFNNPLSSKALNLVAKSVGADVPFFLDPQPSIAEGIGDVLTPVKGLPEYSLVLVKPPFSVSTKDVYKSLELTKKTQFISINALLQAPWNLKNVLVNDLERVVLKMHPVIEELKEWLEDHGAKGVLTTGSGPTVFGVFNSANEAEAVADLAKREFEGYWAKAVSVITEKRDCIFLM